MNNLNINNNIMQPPIAMEGVSSFSGFGELSHRLSLHRRTGPHWFRRMHHRGAAWRLGRRSVARLAAFRPVQRPPAVRRGCRNAAVRRSPGRAEALRRRYAVGEGRVVCEVMRILRLRHSVPARIPAGAVDSG